MSGGSSQPRLAHLARGGASSSSDMHPAKKRRQRAGPRDIADVYDYAVAQSSGGARGEGADRKGKGRARPKGERAARRATAGMHDSDEEEESAYPRRRGGKAQDDDDEEDDEDEDETEIGPTVFDDSDAEEGIQGEDEDIESDEAFGESDEERFDGWKFGERQGDKRATKAPSKVSAEAWKGALRLPDKRR